MILYSELCQNMYIVKLQPVIRPLAHWQVITVNGNRNIRRNIFPVPFCPSRTSQGYPGARDEKPGTDDTLPKDIFHSQLNVVHGITFLIFTINFNVKLLHFSIFPNYPQTLTLPSKFRANKRKTKRLQVKTGTVSVIRVAPCD
jgi:hypothetical protein